MESERASVPRLVRVKPDAHREEIPAGLIGAGEGAELAGWHSPLPPEKK